MFVPLPQNFYGPSAELVARNLLGHFLLRRIGDTVCGGAIVETEAYLSDDPASHGYRRQTPRNQAMWGAPGHAYIYFIYGAHFCFNAVCHRTGVAEAVLVRAVEPTFGVEIMQTNRKVLRARDLTNGPAKLCAALQIDRTSAGADLCDSQSSLFIARNPRRSTLLQERGPCVATARIGISKAADWPLRFYLLGSTLVSKK